MAFFDEIAQATGQMIRFTSIATADQVEFPAFVTSFSDEYGVSWSDEQIFGRIDPIKQYQATTRRINTSFDILGKDRQTAIKNFENYTRLIRMLYPVYSDPIGKENNSRVIKAGPLMRIRYSNYIRSTVSDNGLLGCIQGITFKPEFESGHFMLPNGEMVPIRYSMNFMFVPFHEKQLGSDVTGQFIDKSFPYNVNVRENAPTAIPGTQARLLGGPNNE
jgi:hypothetical protein